MHLRRALLLFAIVLGLAALASSLSRSPDRQTSERRPPTPVESSPQAPSQEERPETELVLAGAGGKRKAVLEAGQAATLLVSVPRPGEVDVPELGLTSAGTPLTPARFELLGDLQGTFAVIFTPAGTEEARTLGTLEVR